MAWIESHQELRDHPKLMRLARALGISRAQAIGHLHALWWWALDYAPDGDLTDYDPEDIADAALWDGDAQQFVDALISCGPGEAPGFVDHVSRDGRVTVTLHDWDVYGNEHKQRQAQAERKRRERARRRTESEARKASGDGHSAPSDDVSRDGRVTVTGDRTGPTGQDRTGLINVEPPGSPAEPAPAPEPRFGEENTAYQLALHLRNAILQRDPSTKVPDPDPGALAKWAIEADRLMRLDGRDPEEAARLIEWCQRDPFWSANVLSMGTFRKQYDRLKRQAERVSNGTRGSPSADTPLHRRLRARGKIP